MRKSISMFMSLLILFIVACTSADYGVAPTYQRMELGNENTLISMTDLQMIRNHFSRSENLDDIPIIEIPEQPEAAYYAARNEDVYVRVILDNPDSQVILRFTLNGIVYQSFEFEEGSTSELLIVKVNAGDVSGIRELTIDEIKYIENVSNETKDAEFEGDRTITMAVTYDQLIEASVTEEVVTSTSYRSVITISDPDNLNAIYENPPVFYLSDGTNIIYTESLTNGNNIIDYPYLHPSKTYFYAVATTYDLLDGEGPQVRISISNEVETESIISIEGSDVTQDTLSFVLIPNDPNSIGIVSAIDLFQEDTIVESLTDLSLRQFSNLSSNKEYKIRVTYTYDLNDGTGPQSVTTSLSITTLAKNITIDTIQLYNSEVYDGDTVRYRIEVTNPDDVEVQSVVIDGQTINVDSNTTTSSVRFRFEVSGKMEILSFVIEEFITNSGQRMAVTTNNILNVFVLSNLMVEDVYESNFELFSTIDDSYTIRFNEPIANYIKELVIRNNDVEQNFNIENMDVLDEYHIKLDLTAINTYETEFSILSVVIDVNEKEYEIGLDYSWRPYIVVDTELNYIQSIEDLLSLENQRIYLLTNDLDFTNYDWNSIDFDGVLIGNNYKFKNYSKIDLDSSNNFNPSIFNNVKGVIQDLVIEDMYIYMEKENTNVFASGFASTLHYGSTLSNINLTGEIHIENTEEVGIGGLVESSNGKILNSYVELTITTTSLDSSIGGLVRDNSGLISGVETDIVINNSSTNSTIYADSVMGGLVAFNWDFARIYDSNVTASINNKSNNYTRIGGVAGYNSGRIELTTSNSVIDSRNFDTDLQDSNHQIGGFVGINDFQGRINQSISDTDIRVETGHSISGGFIGINQGIITNCISKGIVNTLPVGNSGNGNFSGGFVGLNNGGPDVNTLIESSYSLVNSTVNNLSLRFSAGFAAYNQGGSINSSFSHSTGFSHSFIHQTTEEPYQTFNDNYTINTEGLPEYNAVNYVDNISEIMNILSEIWDKNVWDFSSSSYPEFKT